MEIAPKRETHLTVLTHSDINLVSGDPGQSVEEWYHVKTMKEHNDDGPRKGGTNKCANPLTDLEMSGDHKNAGKPIHMKQAAIYLFSGAK